MVARGHDLVWLATTPSVNAVPPNDPFVSGANVAIPDPPMRLVPAVSIAALAGLVTHQAQAAGFYLTDIGTRGMARGGAFIAAPDSLLALHYNPAGLSYLKGLQVELSLSPVIMDAQFQRKCPCVIDRNVVLDGLDANALDAQLEARYTQASKTNTQLYIPFISLGYGLEALDTTIALGVWGPNSGRHDYGALPPATRPTFVTEADTQPGRYSGLQMKTIEVNFGIGFGMRPFKGMPGLDRLRIGGMLMGFQSGNDQVLHMYVNSDTLADIYGRTPENAKLDAPIVFSFKESFAINWAVGANYEIIDGLTFGASFRGQRNIKTSGTIDVTLPAELQGDLRDPTDDVARVTGNEVDVSLSTAPIFRSGLQYEVPSLFRAELAWVWEGWSAHDRVVIQPKGINFEIAGQPAEALGEIVAERRWKDTWSLRLGGEFTLWEPYITLQGGYYYEPTAIAPQRVDPSRIDLDKHGFSVGAATTWYGVTLNLAFQYTKLVGTTVTDSLQTQTAPLDGAQDVLTNIGNGDYSGQYFIFSTGLSFALDPLLAAR